MRKAFLLILSAILLIPNFLPIDINNPLPYDGKERFLPSLNYIQDVRTLESVVDHCASLKNINPQTPEYAAMLAYVISCRFYHGFSHWKLNENWIAAVGQKLTGIGLACKVNADDILKSPNAACSQQALLMMAVLRNKGISYRKVGFPHHYAIEVQFNNKWYYFDPNMEPRMNLAQRVHETWKGDNDVLKSYYDHSIHTNLNYQFGNGQHAELGIVNEIPALRVALFQSVSGYLSRFLWTVPLILAVFSYRRKPFMYAIGPVNQRPIYRLPIRRPYYA
ncbi:MAG TPA: hypothetical protein DHV17_05585 [Chitinophagaceae bacterium]|nr:hypothetical protein [Chitinophagaceae bacterium]